MTANRPRFWLWDVLPNSEFVKYAKIADETYYTNNPIKEWLDGKGYTYCGNMCSVGTFLMGYCPKKVVELLEAAEPTQETEREMSWTGNIYAEDYTEISIEVETEWGVIPFEVFRKEGVSYQVGYDRKQRELHKA